MRRRARSALFSKAGCCRWRSFGAGAPAKTRSSGCYRGRGLTGAGTPLTLRLGESLAHQTAAAPVQPGAADNYPEGRFVVITLWTLSAFAESVNRHSDPHARLTVAESALAELEQAYPTPGPLMRISAQLFLRGTGAGAPRPKEQMPKAPRPPPRSSPKLFSCAFRLLEAVRLAHLRLPFPASFFFGAGGGALYPSSRLINA